ncbi:DUF1631 family protein [Halieaceae bacterium IMCC14734]|uniref:DUF1631 family protein n=1 Tax=Candidatus Litorirhabdus singularis TaxID=2518993 RepID=A0ABT3TCG4_9GAMM|nr:DUF1631 family protein [Candidatus Litorirhabdus singularis]MCX2979501.1 DUF1631 family protein [Candidatus Litorirhabdus singularis]
MTPIPTSPGRIMQHLLQKYPRSTEPDTETDTATVTEQELLDVLLTLGTSVEPNAPLRAIASAALPDSNALAADQSAILDWLDATFASLSATPLLDPALESRIQSMRSALAALAISERDFLLIGKHPVHKMLDTIYERGIGWHSGLERAGRVVTEKLDDIEAALHSQLTKQPRDLAQLNTELNEFFEREANAFSRMRERIIATEQGRLKATSARTSVADALNELMLGAQFPAAVRDFLHGPWFDSMQLTLIKHGGDSDLWHRMLKITETLVWTVQPSEAISDARRQRLYKIIPQLPRELKELLVSLDNSVGEKERVIAQIEEVHFQILRKQPLERLEPEPILNGPTKIRTRVAEQLVEQVLPLEEGQWFTINSEQGDQSRICLALKLNEYQQMLFVNRAGAKVMQKTFEEFSYLMSSGVAETLPKRAGFSTTLHACAGLEQAIENEDVAYRKPRKAVIFRPHTKAPSAAMPAPEPVPAPEPAPEPVPEEIAEPSIAAATEPEQTEAIGLTATNLTEQTPGLSEPADPGDTESTTLTEPLEKTPDEPAGIEIEVLEEPPAAQEKAEAVASKDLPIGSWIKFHDTDGKPAKLAVRVESLDKFIFVDGRGVKKREFKAVQLQLLLDSGRAEILSTTPNFADTVSTIVKDFRSTDSEES